MSGRATPWTGSAAGARRARQAASRKVDAWRRAEQLAGRLGRLAVVAFVALGLSLAALQLMLEGRPEAPKLAAVALGLAALAALDLVRP